MIACIFTPAVGNCTEFTSIKSTCYVEEAFWLLVLEVYQIIEL